MQPRVLINGKWRSHPRVTGVQRYASDLTRALGREGLAFDTATAPAGPAWKSTFWEQRVLPRLAQDYDVLLCPANMGPLRLPTSTSLILTLHCLRFLNHPENYSRGFVRWYELMVPRLLRRADLVLTVSQTIREEIERRYPQSVGKLRVVHPGVNDCFSPAAAMDEPTRELVGDGPYLLYIGSVAPAKNLRMVLDAHKAAPSPPRLVLIGVSPLELEVMTGSGHTPGVTALGHLNDPARVAGLLANARGLLAPSAYESFDLPTLEAMASGCPVIASDLPVHREICADAACYPSDQTPRAWAGAIQMLSDDADFRARLRQLGLARAKRYDWSDAAKRVCAIIDELAGVAQQ